ncbi:MAG: tRNA guanosine(34) transglycosylase Tgt [Chloroflexota bacterium]
MSHAWKAKASCPLTMARAGELTTSHGMVPTPAFMPVGSQGTVKTLSPADLRSTGVDIILGNAYHLFLRPGIQVVEGLGGIHRFTGWDGPILTDSGGYQVFSLAALRHVDDKGIAFRSHIDGTEYFLAPEIAIEVQEGLGADIIMTLDECHRHDLDEASTREAMERTHRWAIRCLNSHRRSDQALYAIVQGGTSMTLRRESARFLTALGFPGYAIGGLSIGEPKALMWTLIEEVVALLPADRPRYLMGVGAPDDIIRAVARGVDLFDSALPTRVARHGGVYTNAGRFNLRNAEYRLSDRPLDQSCDCYTCRTFPVAYLHHLFKCEEMLAYRLATLHNVRFMVCLMAQVRSSLSAGSFDSFKKEFLDRYQPSDEQVRITQKQKWLETRSRQNASG